MEQMKGGYTRVVHFESNRGPKIDSEKLEPMSGIEPPTYGLRNLFPTFVIALNYMARNAFIIFLDPIFDPL